MHVKRSATARQRRRFQALQDMGCIACRQLGHYRQVDVSHLLSGGRRRGHDATIGECPWHHRGVPPDGMSTGQAEQALGPSRARSPRRYRERFGTDDELLAMTNDYLARVQL